MSPPATLVMWFQLRSPDLADDFERLMTEDRDIVGGSLDTVSDWRLTRPDVPGQSIGQADYVLIAEIVEVERFEQQASEHVQRLADDLAHLVSSRGMLVLLLSFEIRGRCRAIRPTLGLSVRCPGSRQAASTRANTKAGVGPALTGDVVVALVAMVTATALFVLTWLAQRPGYNDDEVRTLALVVGIVAEAVLAAGCAIGGANVFVYGIRVVKRPDTPVSEALLGLGEQKAPPPQAASETNPLTRPS
jgi:hypothetical protein